jgi:hypothetical protein
MTSIGNGHLSDKQLLFYVDGELGSRESARVRRHLEACWSCRAKLDDLQGAIKKIVEFRDQVLLPMVPTPPRPWDGLDPRFRESEREAEKPSLTERLRGIFHPEILAVRPTAFLIVILLGLAGFIWLTSRPVITANELLARVEAAQSADLDKVSTPVLHQKLRVRRKVAGSTVEASMDYDSWEDPSRGRFHQTEASAEILTELRTICDANQLDWQAPLSAAGYARWRDSLPAKQDIVAPVNDVSGPEANGGSKPLALTTIPERQTADSLRDKDSGARRITKAELVVRTADWHPVEERLWVNDREYEIAELDYRVLPLSEVNALIFAEPPAPVEPAAAPHPVMIEKTESLAPPPPPDPEETEMAVRYGLHQLDADLGEPIEISRDSQGKVIIDASAVAPELQAKLQQQLASIPNTGLELDRLFSPRCEACLAPSQEATEKSPEQSLTFAPPVNPNEKRLEEIIGGPEPRESFTRNVLAISEDLLSHGFALRNLAIRYPAEEEAKLTPTAKAQLQQMVDDHLEVLMERINSLKGFLWPLLEALSKSPATEVPPPQVPAHGDRSDQPVGLVGAPLTTGQNLDSSSPWQDASLELLARAQRVERLIEGLLARTNDPMPADQVVPALRQTLSEEQQILNQYLTGRGLNKTAEH